MSIRVRTSTAAPLDSARASAISTATSTPYRRRLRRVAPVPAPDLSNSFGSVLDTATDAALNGMNIILPVDGMSSTELYAEQYVAWHMVNAPGVSQKTTLTKIDMIKF